MNTIIGAIIIIMIIVGAGALALRYVYVRGKVAGVAEALRNY
jgi:hypothetical protein